MLIIKRVEIKGIWGQRNIETKLNEDVNIFIGINGTGKTTFLNIIESILTLDFEILTRIDFETVTLVLSGETSKTITVKKVLDEYPYTMIQYRINNKKFEFPLLSSDIDFNMHRIHPRFRAQITDLKEKLGELVKICWLSVHRDVQNNNENEYTSRREKLHENSVDARLKDLMKRLAIYQLQLEAESSSLSTQFRSQMYELMLYNENFDEPNFDKLGKIDADNMKIQLTKAYKDLGLNQKSVKDRINLHTKKLSETLERIDQVKNRDGNVKLQINDIPPISLLNRTLKLIEISNANEEQKVIIFKPITTYLKILKEFIKDKVFKLDTKESGELLIFNRNNEPNSFPISCLSSGEKQLIILLTEALLQKSGKYIFIADEPELSLHINWQRKIVGAIRTLNSKSQIILATHSPEIAGKWSKKIINMETIIEQTRNA